MTRSLSAPVLDLPGVATLATETSQAAIQAPGGVFVLRGPSVTAEKGHLPVRGDLAHIKLAGVYFVPHYAVPLPHRVRQGGAALRADAAAGSDELCALKAGSSFDVLDIAGEWCWGQYGENGPVGYVRLSQLEAPAP